MLRVEKLLMVKHNVDFNRCLENVLLFLIFLFNVNRGLVLWLKAFLYLKFKYFVII